MQALVHTAPNRFEMRDVPIPVIGGKDVLVRVQAVGICGSDVHGMTGKTGRRKPPVIMGHEAAGIIEKTGSDVTSFKPGDRVTFDSTIYCGVCAFCRSGRVNLCDNRRVLGVSCDEYRQDGAMAEYVAVPEHILYRLPETMSFEEGAMIEALSIGVHAVERTLLAKGDTVVIVGCGIIGLMTLQAARAKGAGTIIAVDLDANKLSLAKKFGASVLIDPSKTDVVKAVFDATGGKGADAAFEAVGITQTVATAVKSVRKGGEVTLVGNLAPEVTFPLQSVVTREIRVNGSCASAGEYPRCLELIATGNVDVKTLISKTVPLAEGERWFNVLLENKEPLFKVVLKP
ncbi:MAG: galactitol-1-phosphate 5-dehydrogenase [Spirochaetes bacterium]|nr:galactitol-1-phosphate 5-dehydrogenase [Spirochaetota bacterium]